MTNAQITALRDQILSALLPAVPFDGWTWEATQNAATDAGLQTDIARAVFPDGLQDAVAHFSDWADRETFKKLGAPGKGESSRIRDRIETAAWTRLNVLAPHRDAVRQALAFWSVPPRPLMGSRIVWRTADRIWTWAGDTATDYNRYTKRGILAGVLTTTELAWIQDESEDFTATRDFLSHRIENALQFWSILGRMKTAGRRF